MDTKSLQQYYKTAIFSIRRNSRKNKILLILLSIPAVFYAYFDVNSRYAYYEWDFPHEYLYYLCGLLLAILIVTISTINTFSIINTHRSRNIKYQFKKELFDCIREQIPEIKGYCFYKKIHSKYFIDSGLYNSVFSDYIGDDLFHGEYSGTEFEICELHVFKLFKQIFDGLFIRIHMDLRGINSKDIETCLTSFRNRYKIEFTIRNDSRIYIAVEKHGKFFEQNNLRDIDHIEDDIKVLSDITNLIKSIITYRQHNHTQRISTP